MKNGKRNTTILAILILGLTVTGIAAAAAGYGTEDDPLVTASYINDVVRPEISREIEDAAAARRTELLRAVDEKIAAAGGLQSDALVDAVAARAAIPIPHFKAIFAVIMISGIAFGPETGFLVGAVAAFASNFFYGQGPYTPWQMLGYGVAGLIAGWVFQNKRLPRKPLVMAVFGFVSVVLLVGPVLDTSSVFLTLPSITWRTAWPLYVSGFTVNLSQAICTFLVLLLLGDPFLEKLDRVKAKYGMMEADDDGI